MNRVIVNKKYLTIVLVAMIIAVFSLSVAYAALSVTLSIEGNAQVSASNWDVHLENVRVNSESVSNGTVQIKTATTAEFSTVLEKPGDFYQFTIDVKNDGDIDAMIDSVTKTPSLTEAQTKYFNYIIEYENGESITTNQLVKKNSFIRIKVKIEYKKDLTASDLPTTNQEISLAFTVNYVQDDGSGSIVPDNGNNTYAMLDSPLTVSSGANAVFRSNADVNKFEKVTINGEEVPSDMYTVSSGSTKVMIKKEYIGTLDNGSFYVEIVSNDGVATAMAEKIPEITFKIAGNTYTATPGMTWSQWILSYSMNTSGNNIVWVGLDNKTIYLETRILGDGNIPGSEDVLYDEESGNVQTISSVIQNGKNYITSVACCFDAGSQILMADGTTKNIEDVQVGDMVMSLNEDTGEYIAQRVADTIVNEYSTDLVYVYLSNGVRIGMRAYHPLLTTEGYKSLRPEVALEHGVTTTLLEIGDTLVGYGENVTVVDVEEREHIPNYKTYNLSIEGYHNYIVEGIVAHNAGCST